MKHLIFIILTLTILATSCDKDKNLTVISGVVVQKNTLKPIHNAELIITQYYSKGVMQGIVEWPVDTIYTDLDGRFEWKSDIHPYNKYYNSSGGFDIRHVAAKNYFKMDDQAIAFQGNTTSFRHLDKVDLNIQMTPHAYLELSLINAAVPDTDYCRFTLKGVKAGKVLYGDNFTADHIIEGNQMHVYKYALDPALTDWKKDSFYIQAFETKKLEILY